MTLNNYNLHGDLSPQLARDSSLCSPSVSVRILVASNVQLSQDLERQSDSMNHKIVSFPLVDAGRAKRAETPLNKLLLRHFCTHKTTASVFRLQALVKNSESSSGFPIPLFPLLEDHIW